MTQEALRMALEALITASGHLNNEAFVKVMMARDAVVEALAQEQEPVAWADMGTRDVDNDAGLSWTTGHFHTTPLYTHPPQLEQNFCPRCGKRTNDIHTCTPPEENT